MLNLIKNELIKIFKRKHIYILLLIVILTIIIYNFIIEKGAIKNNNISELYQQIYIQDKIYMQNYDNLNLDEKYSDIEERVNLEKYAIENNIKYNILLNSENPNMKLPADARISFMKVFENFDLLIITIIIFISSTIISEEYSKGTIKNLLVKPHKRISILFSKIITCLLVITIIAIFVIITQYIVGGMIFGFESYKLEVIRYNHLTQNIVTMNLGKYMFLMLICKLPMYIIISLISLLLGVITNNIAINILITLGLYLMSKIEIMINSLSKYLTIYNWDISKFIYGGFENISDNIIQPIIISGISMVIAFIILIELFKYRDVRNV